MQLTTPPQRVEAISAQPEFCDAKQLRQLFGLTRTHAYLLAARGKIHSISIRKPGAFKGKRLFDCQSVRNFLNRCGEEGEGKGDEPAEACCHR